MNRHTNLKTKRTLMALWAAIECRQLDIVKAGLRESSATVNVHI